MLENEEGDHGKVSGKNGYQNEKKKTHTHTSLADITSYTQIYKRV